MKKFLSMLLTLIMFLSLLVSCGNEEISSSQSETKSESSSESIVQSESTGEESKSEIPSETESETILDDNVLNNITRDTFANAYQSWIGWYYETGIEEGECRHGMFACAKAIFTYEEFQKGAIDFRPTGITEQTFEDNFVLVIRGCEGHIRSYDIHYTDFKKEGDYYTLTYNRISPKDGEVSEAVQEFCDVCIIPKELCNDTNPQIIKVIEKHYMFLGEEYNSPCKLYTEIHDVIGD
ncbi:MAG: hypothetical protein IJZ04_08090 [Clostridia bacterium]|nr:hypothetical protein [Clostridia bacterium]